MSYFIISCSIILSWCIISYYLLYKLYRLVSYLIWFISIPCQILPFYDVLLQGVSQNLYYILQYSATSNHIRGMFSGLIVPICSNQTYSLSIRQAPFLSLEDVWTGYCSTAIRHLPSGLSTNYNMTEQNELSSKLTIMSKWC